MKKKTLDCLLEAYRRWLMMGEGEGMTASFLGLGTASQYKDAVAEGYMKWVESQPPKPHIYDWLTLTPKGAKVFRQFAAKRIGTKDSILRYGKSCQFLKK
jgi:hypothetical protein